MADYHPVRLANNIFEPDSGVNPSLAPLLFLHGATASKEHWLHVPQKVANATKRRAYALDARNHGDSEWTDNFNFDINADDVLHFMDTNKISKAILIGHSMGGITAIRVALRWPDRIERIIVEDMYVRKLTKEIVDSVLMYVSLARKAIEAVPATLDEKEATLSIFKSIFAALSTETRVVDMKEESLHLFRLRRDEEGRYQYKANIDVIEKSLRDLETLMSEPSGIYEGPALFIYGKVSLFMVGDDEDHIKKFFPNAVLEGLEDAGHSIHNERPEEFMDAVLKFLS